MTDWIARYVADVVRRLPEKDRDEVRRELAANIQDMLPDDAGEEEIKAVLNSLGPPAQLAEQYRQKPRYLISPAVYDAYVRALKWVVPLVGGILLIIGAILGTINAINDGMVDLSQLIGGSLSRGISFGVSGTLQAVLWTTIGFVIAERTGAKIAPAPGEWTVEQLPAETLIDKGRIPLSDSIVEMVLVVVFTAFFTFFCLEGLPFAFVIQYGNMQIHQLFSNNFLAALIPVLIVSMLLSVCVGIIKIVQRRWTPLVCCAIVVNNLASIGLMLYLFTRPQIFSVEFMAFLQAQNWGSFDLLRLWGQPLISGNPILLLVAVIVIISSLVECGTSIYKTVKTYRPAV